MGEADRGNREEHLDPILAVVAIASADQSGQVPYYSKLEHTVMGIRSNKDQDTDHLSAFSEDNLRIEISGPDMRFLRIVYCS